MPKKNGRLSVDLPPSLAAEQRGEVAILRARTTYVKPDGQPGAGRYTDVWARREGRWLCVAANVSRG